MNQAWLQVIGIVVEFAGVVLLAWEWFAAKRQDHAELALAEAQSRREQGTAGIQRLQADNPQMQRHYEMTRDMQRRMTAAQVNATRSRLGGLRTRAVVAALLFVSAGFVLQLLGTWPGCCDAIGVAPF